MNKVILIGRLGSNPEMRYTADGMAIANVSLATSSYAKGEERTEWHRLVAFSRTAELLNEHASKGSTIGLEGKIQTRKWQDKDGRDRYTTEIVVDRFEFVGPKNSSPAQRPDDAGFRDEAKFTSDEIPF